MYCLSIQLLVGFATDAATQLKGVIMKQSITRKQFLALAGIGAISTALMPETALARESATLSGQSGTALLNYIDRRYPELFVTISDPTSTQVATLDPASVAVKSSKSYFDPNTHAGETYYEIDFLETEFDKKRFLNLDNINSASSSSGDSSDAIASITVKTTWNLSGNNKKINLTKVTVKFVEKKGTLTARGVTIKNDDKKHEADSKKINNTYSYAPTWGFRDYHDLDRERNHFVNAWATAVASGMGGKREIRCMVVYGG